MSTLSSIVIKKRFIKTYKNKRKFEFYGTIEEYLNIINILKASNNDFGFILNRKNIGDVSEQDCNGIILSKISFKESDLKYLISKDQKYKTDFYFIDDWIETNLNIIPNDYVNYDRFLNKYNFIKRNTFGIRLKRFGDIFLSITLLIILFPILMISMIFIWLTDKGSVIYKQRRVGMNGKEFNIYKLRTMILNAEKYGPEWVAFRDKRITLIGKILRKTRIDEIPQLICVINGDMSLIGPRPERPEIDDKLKNSLDNYELRYLVKPGLSGWAQVNSNYAASLESVRLKLSYDLYYISNQSLWIDFLILIKTIKVVFTAQGSEPIN